MKFIYFYATGAQVIKMSLSVGITFIASKIWPNARWRNLFVNTCVDMCACMHARMFTYLHMSVKAGGDSDLCECAHACANVCVCER